MLVRYGLAAVVVLVMSGMFALADPPTTEWRSAGNKPPAAAIASRPTPAPHNALTGTVPGNTVPGNTVPGNTVPGGNVTLPNQHGQVWREYDISPYTLRVTSTKRPEQAIVDWILRDTGYEAWHGEPLGILSAGRRALRVYHTPEMQAVVAGVVDRFVAGEAQTRTFNLRVVTVNHPNWRAKAQGLLRPVAVRTPGVQAWVLQQEDAAMLLANLRRRNDYREHSSPYMMVNNGQSSVISITSTRNYIRGVTPRAEAWPGFGQETSQVEEGFSLEFSPLLSVDGKSIDATVKCTIDQVEKMIPVMLEVPTSVAPRQRVKIEVPQISHFRFHERFRWPSEQVLLIGMGMVPLPTPGEGKSLVPGIPLPLPNAPARADLLVFVKCKSKSSQSAAGTRSALREAKTYHGRY